MVWLGITWVCIHMYCNIAIYWYCNYDTIICYNTYSSTSTRVHVYVHVYCNSMLQVYGTEQVSILHVYFNIYNIYCNTCILQYRLAVPRLLILRNTDSTGTLVLSTYSTLCTRVHTRVHSVLYTCSMPWHAIASQLASQASMLLYY